MLNCSLWFSVVRLNGILDLVSLNAEKINMSC